MSSPEPQDSEPLTPDLAGLRRLERRIARASTWRAGGRRVYDSVPAIAQIIVGAILSYLTAHFLVGHENPIMAVTVVISSLGFNRDSRPIRVLESVFGITLGVGLAALVVMIWGNGVWQLAIVLSIVMSLGRLLVKNPAFAVAASVPATLTVILPAPAGGPFERLADGAIGAAFALIVTALIPRNPTGVAARDGKALFSVLVEAFQSVAEGLRDGDTGASELALSRAHRAEPLVVAWRQSLSSAIAISRISPFLRRRLPELYRARRVLEGAEATSRHLLLIARRSAVITRDHEHHEALAELVATVGDAIRLLHAELGDLELAGAARSVLSDLAGRLHPATAIPGGSVAESTVVVQLRPLVVDLLVATGLSLPDAQRRLAAL